MNITTDISAIEKPVAESVVTIGNFDGVHKGHRALFRVVKERAEATGGTSVAITFEPHPLVVIRPDHRPPLITQLEQKIELIEKTGSIDELLVIPFDKTFSDIPAPDFIREVLVEKIGMQAIVVGPDYAFGKDRAGNIDLLKKMGSELGFEVITPEWVESENQGDRISSTRIRSIVSAGEVHDVVEMLGRHYQIRGKVVTGRQRGGKLLGFPTANIALQDELCPATGVYVVRACTEDNIPRLGVANIGYSPTFDDHQFTIEVHIVDFEGDLYGKKLRVDFLKRLRSEMKFSGLDALMEQISQDVEEARAVFARMHPAP